MDLARQVQIALLGEVPPTLRFVYAWIEHDTLHLVAVFADEASDDDLECARVAFTEVIAGQASSELRVVERIERDSSAPWKMHGGLHLMYLRHGELSEV